MTYLKEEFGYFLEGEGKEPAKESIKEEKGKEKTKKVKEVEKNLEKEKLEKERKEKIKQLKEKSVLIQKKEGPKERAILYLKILEEAKEIDNKKFSEEVLEKTVNALKEDSKEWKKGEKIELLSKAVDLSLENKLFIVDKKTFVFEEIFNLWRKEIKDLDSKSLEKTKNLKESEELITANRFNQKALETAFFLSWNLKEPWIDKESRKEIKEKEKEEIIIDFTKKWLEENNPLKPIKENKKLLERIQKENISLIFEEEAYQNVFSLLYLKGIPYQNLEPLINQTLKEKSLKEKVENDFFNFMNLKKEEKEKEAQKVIQKFGLSLEKFTFEKEKKEEEKELEKLTEEAFVQMFEILKESDPEFASKLKTLLEKPEAKEKLQEILNAQKREIENLYQEISKKEGEEKTEEIKKAKEKVKESLLKAGLSLSCLAFLMLSAIILLKSIEWANNMAKKLSQTKFKF